MELKGLEILINLISGDFIDSRTREKDDSSSIIIPSKGYTNYSFLDYITYKDKKECDIYRIDSDNDLKDGYRKQIIKVKCLPNRGNGTVHIVQSSKEILKILSPHGNSTKRNIEGNCALILFYTKSCPGSAIVAPQFNALAKQFPDIKIAAIDAYKFHSFNTEFGIVGLPTILLFHQGRPVVKYNDTIATVQQFIKFVTRHTGIKPYYNSGFVSSEDFNGPLLNRVEKEPDKYLYLAWSFIIICAGYYFTKSSLYTQIVEIIKRNWRESEAQHEQNN